MEVVGDIAAFFLPVGEVADGLSNGVFGGRVTRFAAGTEDALVPGQAAGALLQLGDNGDEAPFRTCARIFRGRLRGLSATVSGEESR